MAVVVAGFAAVLIHPPISNPALAHELIRLARDSSTHTARVKEILAKHGWPDDRAVGSEGSHAAWLLVQRSYQDVDFQQRALALMQAAADHVSKMDLAYLTDRVAVASGQPQTYGIEISCTDGKPVLATPVKDEAAADRLRRAAHMDSLGQSLAQLAKLCQAMNEPLLRPPTGPPGSIRVVPRR
ncbi:MAG: hypothetical protein QOF21_1499 [Actinomycetota bacterium]